MESNSTEWLGKMPLEWKFTTIGKIYEERKTKVLDTDYEALSITKNGIVKQLSSAVKASEGSDRKLVCQGDFVINSRSDRRGSNGISNYDGSCSVINTVIHSRENTDTKYFDYVLTTDMFSEEFYRWGHGIASDLWTTRWQEMKKIMLPLPPKEEQKRISEFLDKKCENIDKIIEQSALALEEFKRIKSSIIEQAITRGINVNEQLVQSGYKEYGLIPSHWKIVKLKRIFRIKKEIAGKEGIQVLSITQKGIIPKDITKNEGQMAQDYSGYQFVSKGDYAMNHMDLLTGWVDISIYDGVTSPDYRVFVLNDESSFSKKYYLYFLQYCYSKQIFYSLAQGVSEFGRCRLKADKFLHYDVLYPPYKEQCEIAEYLDEKTGIVDNNISKIDILKKYRNTIIYDYATGKKEVPQE